VIPFVLTENGVPGLEQSKAVENLSVRSDVDGFYDQTAANTFARGTSSFLIVN